MFERSEAPNRENAADLPCPKCGSAMVRRVAKRGENAGSEFWGCSTFPKCRSLPPISSPQYGRAPTRSASLPYWKPPLVVAVLQDRPS